MESFIQSILILVILAFLLDVVIGDPRWLPHPVIGMGKLISAMEKSLNKGSATARRFHGAVLTLALVGGVYVLTRETLEFSRAIHPLLGWGFEILFISTALAGKSLHQAGLQIAIALQDENIFLARQYLQGLVSRDTSKLQEPELVRGTVESLFENFVDGFLSPFFFALIGGAPLAMAFKAISTLDSMIGYRNDRYLNFGWFAAKTDDWANYLPARFSVLILLLAGALHRCPVKQALTIWRRDASKHPSPNGGNPESIGAGLLGVKLGGLNVYHGKPEYRAEMGEALHPLTYNKIFQGLNLIRTASWLTWGITALTFVLLLFEGGIRFPWS